MKKTICVDFDGVLHSYTSGWQGSDVIPDPPVTGAIDWLVQLVDAGLDVCIYSSRSKDEGGVRAMMQWLIAYGLPPSAREKLSFPTQKPGAWLTIDDRCFRFEGDFPSVGWIERFKPWNK